MNKPRSSEELLLLKEKFWIELCELSNRKIHNLEEIKVTRINNEFLNSLFLDNIEIMSKFYECLLKVLNYKKNYLENGRVGLIKFGDCSDPELNTIKGLNSQIKKTEINLDILNILKKTEVKEFDFLINHAIDMINCLLENDKEKNDIISSKKMFLQTVKSVFELKEGEIIILEDDKINKSNSVKISLSLYLSSDEDSQHEFFLHNMNWKSLMNIFSFRTEMAKEYFLDIIGNDVN